MAVLAHVQRIAKAFQDVARRIHSILGIKVTLVEPKTLERFTGKAKRVIDKRNPKG